MYLVKGRYFNQNLSELLILVLAVQLDFSLVVILQLGNGPSPFKSSLVIPVPVLGSSSLSCCSDQRIPDTKHCSALNLV